MPSIGQPEVPSTAQIIYIQKLPTKIHEQEALRIRGKVYNITQTKIIPSGRDGGGAWIGLREEDRTDLKHPTNYKTWLPRSLSKHSNFFFKQNLTKPHNSPVR